MEGYDKVKKSYKENRYLYLEVYSRYCSHASMAKQNDPLYLDARFVQDSPN